MHQSLEDEGIRRKIPLSLKNVRKPMAECVTFSQTERLRTAIGPIAPTAPDYRIAMTGDRAPG